MFSFLSCIPFQITMKQNLHIRGTTLITIGSPLFLSSCLKKKKQFCVVKFRKRERCLGLIWIIFFSSLITLHSISVTHHSSFITHYSLLKIPQFLYPTRLANIFKISSPNFLCFLWDPLFLKPPTNKQY